MRKNHLLAAAVFDIFLDTEMELLQQRINELRAEGREAEIENLERAFQEYVTVRRSMLQILKGLPPLILFQTLLPNNEYVKFLAELARLIGSKKMPIKEQAAIGSEILAEAGERVLRSRRGILVQ